MISNILNRLSTLSFIGLSFAVLFYIPWFFLKDVPAILGIGLMSCMLIFLMASRTDALTMIGKKLSSINWSRFDVVSIIILGLLLRIVWILLVPPVQYSDMVKYWDSAQRLLEKHSYYNVYYGHVLLAQRPPGYPFLLAAAMALFGHSRSIPALINLISYVLASLATYSIAHQYINKHAALLAITLLAFWPSQIAFTGLALTEPLSMGLYVASVWALLKATENGWRYAVLTGLLTGIGILVRPSLLLVPCLWALYAIASPTKCKLILWNSIVSLFVVGLVIVPWSVRNYVVLGEVVPVSTNGGDVFYRSNNPLASGGYTENGERDLSALIGNEILWEKTGYTWGKEWIKENPLAFLKLAIKKQGILLGDDTEGVYSTLKMGHGKVGFSYLLLASISNAWWMVVWFLAAVGSLRWRSMLKEFSEWPLFFWMIFYMVAVHSVYESQSRHHMVFGGVLVIIAGLSFFPPKFKAGTEPKSLEV